MAEYLNAEWLLDLIWYCILVYSLTLLIFIVSQLVHLSFVPLYIDES